MSANIFIIATMIALLVSGSSIAMPPDAWPRNWFAIPQQNDENLMCARSIGIHFLNPHYEKFGVPGGETTRDVPADLSEMIVAVRRAQEAIVAEMGADSAIWTRSDMMLVGYGGRSVVLHRPHLQIKDGREQHVQDAASEMAPQSTTLLHYRPGQNGSPSWDTVHLGMCRPGSVQLHGAYVVIYEDKQRIGRMHRLSGDDLINVELPDLGPLRAARFSNNAWAALSGSSIMFGTVEEDKMLLISTHDLANMSQNSASLQLGSLQSSSLLGISEDGTKALLSNLCRIDQAGNITWIGDGNITKSLDGDGGESRWNLYGYSAGGTGDSYALIRQLERSPKIGDFSNTKYWAIKIDRHFEQTIAWQLPLPDIDAPIAVSPCGMALLVLSESRKAQFAISRPVACYCIEWGESLRFIGIGRSASIGWYVPIK